MESAPRTPLAPFTGPTPAVRGRWTAQSKRGGGRVAPVVLLWAHCKHGVGGAHTQPRQADARGITCPTLCFEPALPQREATAMDQFGMALAVLLVVGLIVVVVRNLRLRRKVERDVERRQHGE